MHILHVYKDYPPVLGGIEAHIQTLARHQVHQGLQVTVLVTNPAPLPAGLRTRVSLEDGVTVIRSGRCLTTASTPLSPVQAWWQRRLRPDVVHLHFPYPPGEVANLLWGQGRVTVITYHSDVIRQQLILRLYRPLLRRVLARADAIIATSHAYVTSSPFLAPLADSVQVIPLGIDLDPFLHADQAAARTLRARFTGDRSDHHLLLFVGRLRYYKGVDVLLRALVQVPGAVLLVVGAGPMKQAWEALARDLGLGPRVHFLGDVPAEALPAHYAAADLFILPATSRAEAMGLVLVEAMATGVPVISTELGTGTSYVNQHGVTGLVVPPGDVTALTAAIDTLLADPRRRERMGRRAQARVRQEFDAAMMAERVLEVYTRALGCAAQAR